MLRSAKSTLLIYPNKNKMENPPKNETLPMTDYFGGQATYSYDALGRLTSIANPFGEVTTFQYDANSRLIRNTLPNCSCYPGLV